MESLRQQINPYLTAQPDPDQTFREYIEQLLEQQPSRDFQSAFTGPTAEESSANASTPTTSITEGMFRPYLGDSGGGSSDFGVASTSAGLGGFSSANDVVALDAMAQAASTTAGKEAISQVVGLMTGNPIAGVVAGLVAPMALSAAGNQAWSSFNQGIDASNAAFGTAAALGGVGTVSNQAGHVSSITNPAMVDAFDMATFGTTGAGLAASGGSGGIGSSTGSGISTGGSGLGLSTGGGLGLSAPSSGFGDFGGGGGDSGGFGGGLGDSGPSGSSGAGGASAAGPGESDGGGGGGGGGGGKIVCTAMNQSYGFGSFRQAIWLRYSADHMTKEHEVGYHAMFLPLVDAAYKQDKWYSKPLRKVLENIARHRTADIRAEMREGKRDTLGRVYRAVLEPLCYVVGKIKTL